MKKTIILLLSFLSLSVAAGGGYCLYLPDTIERAKCTAEKLRREKNELEYQIFKKCIENEESEEVGIAPEQVVVNDLCMIKMYQKFHQFLTSS